MYQIIKLITVNSQEEVLLTTEDFERCAFINLYENKHVDIDMSHKNIMGDIVSYVNDGHVEEILFIDDSILSGFVDEVAVMCAMEIIKDPILNYIKKRTDEYAL